MRLAINGLIYDPVNSYYVLNTQNGSPIKNWPFMRGWGGVRWGTGGGGLGSDFHFYPHSTRAICEGQSTDYEHGKDSV